MGSAATANHYFYDDEFRLTRASTDTGTGGTETETFAFDAVDNRTAHSGVNGAWLYDDNYRLLQQGQGTGSASFSYDEAGNLIRKTEAAGKVTDFSYDTANRVREVRLQGQLLARYDYDPAGRRIWKEQFRTRDGVALLPAQRSYYLYGDEGLLAEARQAILLNADGSTTQSGTAAIVTQYGPTPDSQFTTMSLFAKTRDSNNEERYAYFIHDQRGAPVQAVDKLGHIVWAARYDTFGRATIISPAPTADLPTIALALRMPGQVEDEETGLYYNWHRTYDPSTGRYLERDPAGLAGGLNPYQYVFGNPTTLVDPLGKTAGAAAWIRPALGLGLRIGAGVAAVGSGTVILVGSAAIVAGGAACWLSESCRNWVKDRWNNTFAPAVSTVVTTGAFCLIPPGYMNEQRGGSSGNKGNGNSNSNSNASDSSTGSPPPDDDDDGYDDDEPKKRGEKGQTFRGGKKSQRDNWYGQNDKDFQKWWHRTGKSEFNGGRDIQDAKNAQDAMRYWRDIGKPVPK